jgi:hypothetical protein
MSAFSLFFFFLVRFFKKIILILIYFISFYFLGYQNRMGMDGSFVFCFLL